MDRIWAIWGSYYDIGQFHILSTEGGLLIFATTSQPDCVKPVALERGSLNPKPRVQKLGRRGSVSMQPQTSLRYVAGKSEGHPCCCAEGLAMRFSRRMLICSTGNQRIIASLQSTCHFRAEGLGIRGLGFRVLRAGCEQAGAVRNCSKLEQKAQSP